MNRIDLPSEEEQFEAYKHVAKAMAPNQVTIRSLDLGGDKFISSLEIPRDMYPYLGWRAIRFCLARPDIFKTQLRAIMRASIYGKIRLMYPMISGPGELHQANLILNEVKNNLREEKISRVEAKYKALEEGRLKSLENEIEAKRQQFLKELESEKRSRAIELENELELMAEHQREAIRARLRKEVEPIRDLVWQELEEMKRKLAR